MAKQVAESAAKSNQRRTLKLLKPFICQGCNAHLGMTDGAELTMGVAVICRVVTLKCGECGKIRVWRPVGRKGG